MQAVTRFVPSELHSEADREVRTIFLPFLSLPSGPALPGPWLACASLCLQQQGGTRWQLQPCMITHPNCCTVPME